jgi:hypothetical protein
MMVELRVLMGCYDVSVIEEAWLDFLLFSICIALDLERGNFLKCFL